jgi:hypothetical protein
MGDLLGDYIGCRKPPKNKLDTLLLKQKKLPVMDITGIFFRIRTQVTACVDFIDHFLF